VNRALVIVQLAIAGCAGLTPTAIYTPDTVERRGSTGADVVVPDLIGKTREEAEALVAAAGFASAVESSRPVECEDAPQVEGRINCQSPAPGATVKDYVVVQINVYAPTRIAGAIVRDQLVTLYGLTADGARAALAGWGHDGSVMVLTDDAHRDGCEVGRVCRFDRPESGMGVHDAITLYVNPPP
jgi:hypothetical protein